MIFTLLLCVRQAAGEGPVEAHEAVGRGQAPLDRAVPAVLHRRRRAHRQQQQQRAQTRAVIMEKSQGRREWRYWDSDQRRETCKTHAFL